MNSIILQNNNTRERFTGWEGIRQVARLQDEELSDDDNLHLIRDIQPNGERWYLYSEDADCMYELDEYIIEEQQ